MSNVDVLSPAPASGVLTDEALDFVGALHERFEPRRRELLAARVQRRARIAGGATLDFLPETRDIREGDWQVAAAPADYRDRRVEITGPVDRKMIINALNSGARGFMADFEDSLSPTWSNVVQGQVNLTDAIEGTIEFTGDDGREYRARRRGGDAARAPARLAPGREARAHRQPAGGRRVRRRGAVPLPQRPAAGRQGQRPVLLPAQDGVHTSRRGCGTRSSRSASPSSAWNPGRSRRRCSSRRCPPRSRWRRSSTSCATHSARLNAGRWDYIFSTIKTFRERPEFVLPRPQRRDDDGAVHARVHRAAGEDLPSRAGRTRWAAWPR